jgi:nicotinamide mononucleotide adenylyltransferase
MFLTELFEDTHNTLVVYPGRFQPFHKGHKAVYDQLVKQYGRDSVFIATSNKVEQPKSPFSFSDKVQFMTLTGVPLDRIAEDPRFKSWTKKDGTPTYFQPMPKDTAQIQTFDKHGYIKVVPTVEFTVLGHPMRSATEIRASFAKADTRTQKAIVQDLFGSYNDAVLHIMQHKLAK